MAEVNPNTSVIKMNINGQTLHLEGKKLRLVTYVLFIRDKLS